MSLSTLKNQSAKKKAAIKTKRNVVNRQKSMMDYDHDYAHDHDLNEVLGGLDSYSEFRSDIGSGFY